MAVPWIGEKTVLFIPLIVEGRIEYDAPPPDFRDLVERRALYDPDPVTGFDRSLRAYIHAVSYGRARLSADISNPITINDLQVTENPTLRAINAHPTVHLYEYVAVVYPEGPANTGGMAQPGQVSFSPPRSPNKTLGRARFRLGHRVGVWAMEILHITTGFGDLYFSNPHPGLFDEMAAASATHPSVYTKRAMGWIDAQKILTAPPGVHTYDLHAVGYVHPAPPGRFAAVRVNAKTGSRYLLIESRLRGDEWERGARNVQNDIDFVDGIPSEGVVVYEFDPDWPLHLLTPTALQPGETLTRNGVSVKVTSQLPAGSRVRVTVEEPPACADLRKQLQELRSELREAFRHLGDGPEPEVTPTIQRLKAAISATTAKMAAQGCQIP